MTAKRTILITGCSDGSLGSHLALAFHHRKWRVFASARNLAKLSKVQEAGIECVEMDVSSPTSIKHAVVEVEKLTGGSLDVLFNNAGKGYSRPVLDADIQETRDLFETNVFSIISVTQAFTPLLLASTDHRPMIVNTTSGSGLLGCGTPFQGLYATSKAAAVQLTEMMRLELAPLGIRVVNIVCGGVESSFHLNANETLLPQDSIYNVAKEELEQRMRGNAGQVQHDATTWAENVARDLDRENVSHMIYRGAQSSLARFATLVPIGWLDSIPKSGTGIDLLEAKIREQGGSQSLLKRKADGA